MESARALRYFRPRRRKPSLIELIRPVAADALDADDVFSAYRDDAHRQLASLSSPINNAYRAHAASARYARE